MLLKFSLRRVLITTVIMTAFFVPTFAFNKAFASLQITEIMYDVPGTDTGREWIEVFNSGSNNIDITKIKLFEADTNHGVSVVEGGNILGALGYAILADNPTKFKVDFPSYNGLLFDSAFSLGNDGESLSLKNEDGAVVDTVNYDVSIGAKGDGKSLQKITDLWVSSTPTPGLENVFLDNNSNSTTTDNTSTTTQATTTQATSTSQASTSTNTTTSTQIITRTVIQYVSTHSNPEDLSDYSDEVSFEISAGRERIGYTGVPVKFSAKNNSLKILNCSSQNYVWVYGDGSKDVGENSSHIYKFPGEYNIVLNGSCGGQNAVSRTKIKILSPEVSFGLISSGDLEISNFGKTEINIGGWGIAGSSTGFVIPEDTIISASGTVIFPKEYLKIPMNNNEVLNLVDPSGNVIFSFKSFMETDLANPILDGMNSINIEVSKKEIENFTTAFLQNIKNENQISFVPTKTLINTDVDKNTESIASSTKSFGVATVLESTKSPETKGFWKTVFGLPVRGIKAVARVFYDVE